MNINLKIIKFENLNEELNTYFKELNIEEEFNIHENKNEKKCFDIHYGSVHKKLCAGSYPYPVFYDS